MTLPPARVVVKKHVLHRLCTKCAMRKLLLRRVAGRAPISSLPLPQLLPYCYELLHMPRRGKVSIVKSTAIVRGPVEVLDSCHAHHRESALQFVKLGPA